MPLGLPLGLLLGLSFGLPFDLPFDLPLEMLLGNAPWNALRNTPWNALGNTPWNALGNAFSTDEIHLLIGDHLYNNALYSLIRTCRSLYSAYIVCLWSNVTLQLYEDNIIDASAVRANIHRIETIHCSSNLTEDYYTNVFPRLHALRFDTFYGDEKLSHYLQVQPAEKIQFIRHHPFVRALTYEHKDVLPKEFWEVVGTEWTSLEDLSFSGLVEADALDAFWRVCDRVQTLSLTNANLPESVPILSTLSFQQLQQLSVVKYNWPTTIPHRTWPLQLFKQVRKSPGLRLLAWRVTDVAFPARMFQDTLAEKDCWPKLCELDIDDYSCTDQELAQILTILPSRRLTSFDHSGDRLGPLTFDCLRQLYPEHLTELNFRNCCGTTSAMIQVMLMGCAHLVHFVAPYLLVRDIVTAPKPWACLKLEKLAVYIAREKSDETGWDGQVIEQIAKLRRLLDLSLAWEPSCSLCVGRPSFRSAKDLETLDLRIRPETVVSYSHSTSVDNSSSGDGGDGCGDEGVGGSDSEGSVDIRCWSSLVQLREFSFSDDRQTFGMKEALWMVEYWRDLWSLNGAFEGVVGDDVDKLDRLFKEKGVSYY
ncbi:hypothetical protein BG015_003438, partial [Linnemannia schmuckeri]